MIRPSNSNHLYRFLDWFVHRSLDDLMVPYQPSGPYLSDVLFRCSRTDSLYRFRSLDGQTLYRLAHLLLARNRKDLRPPTPDGDEKARKLEAPGQIIVPGDSNENADSPQSKPEPAPPSSPPTKEGDLTCSEGVLYRRHVGDLALFLSGLFRRHLDHGGILGLYLHEGKRAYRSVAARLDSSKLGSGREEQQRLFADLAEHFSEYVDALDYMQKVYLSKEEGAEEGFHRFREELDQEWEGWIEEENQRES